MLTINSQTKHIVRNDNGDIIGEFDIVNMQSNGLLFAKNSDSNWNVYNKEGICTTENVDYIIRIDDFVNDMAIFTKRNGLQGIINADGKIIPDVRYYTIYNFNEYGIAIVKNINGYNLINQQGQQILTDSYNEIKEIGNGFFSAYKTPNKKYAVINNKGQLITEFKYHSIEQFNENFIICSVCDFYYEPASYGVLDVSGKTILEPCYSSVFVINQNYIFAFSSKNNVFIIFNKLGEQVSVNNYNSSQHLAGDDKWIAEKIKALFAEHPNAEFVNGNISISCTDFEHAMYRFPH